MMEFTNSADLARSAVKYNLRGWYVQDLSDGYLGILRETDGEWYVGFTSVDDVVFPVTVASIPQ